MEGKFWLFVLGALLVAVIVGQFDLIGQKDRGLIVTLETCKSPTRTLFVLVHGFNPKVSNFESAQKILAEFGDVLRLEYQAGLLSNKSPEDISLEISHAVASAEGRYDNITIVAHSVGALLSRRAMLDGHQENLPWIKKTGRLVLLAGTNRGWRLDGAHSPDFSRWQLFGWYIGIWGARLSGIGKFILNFQAGSPFVANLRLDWMRWMQQTSDGSALEVIQLLGDIDNVVSSEDNEDLRIMASRKYALLRVRGTGHRDIMDFANTALGNYRREKLLLAATQPFPAVVAQNEEQPYTTQPNISAVIFVLHGIRDLGTWSSAFESDLHHSGASNVAIVSPRYGYLGMGPFLIPAVRDRYVRWFMDEYTEALARYPKVDPSHIYFFGHSNGTYLLASALTRYNSMRIDRVVFAGSVVRKNYDWEQVIRDGQVRVVRNYVATADWVVALFPRLFEFRPFLWLRNSLGSAGFSGFDDGNDCASEPPAKERAVENVCYVSGSHGAFEGRVQEIVQFFLSSTPSPALHETRPMPARLLGWNATVLATWLLIVGLISFLGISVVSAAPSPRWVILIAFCLLVIRALQTI